MGELLALRWRDVDFPGRTIRVRAGDYAGQLATPKSGKVRAVPTAPDVATALARLGNREHWVGDDDLVFAGEVRGRLDASALRRRYKLALAHAGAGRLSATCPASETLAERHSRGLRRLQCVHAYSPRRLVRSALAAAPAESGSADRTVRCITDSRRGRRFLRLRPAQLPSARSPASTAWGRAVCAATALSAFALPLGDLAFDFGLISLVVSCLSLQARLIAVDFRLPAVDFRPGAPQSFSGEL